MTLSIIVPIYNAAKTLDRCIESLTRQTGVTLEIILVDDGSTDESPRLCEVWARRSKAIRAIHRPNGGLSEARNIGITAAQGDYLTFVDADDYVADDTYRRVLQTAEADADIIEFPVWKEMPDGRVEKTSWGEDVYFDKKKYWLTTAAYRHTYACNKIYRRYLFEQVRFPKGRIFEDAYTYPLLLERAKMVQTCQVGVYHYTHNGAGITAKAKGEDIEQLLKTQCNTLSALCDDDYYLYLLNLQITVYQLTKRAPLLPDRKVCLNGKRPFKILLKAIMVDTFGVQTTCRMFHLFQSRSLCR